MKTIIDLIQSDFRNWGDPNYSLNFPLNASFKFFFTVSKKFPRQTARALGLADYSSNASDPLLEFILESMWASTLSPRVSDELDSFTTLAPLNMSEIVFTSTVLPLNSSLDYSLDASGAISTFLVDYFSTVFQVLILPILCYFFF